MSQCSMDKETFARETWALRGSMLRLARSILGRPADAEDAVSEAVLRAWERLGSLRDATRFKPWLLRIVSSCCYNALRKSRRTAYYADMNVLGLETPPDQAHDLWQWLQCLPEGYRTVLTLYYYERMRAEEIAAVLGLSKGTVTSRLKRGRDILKRQMEQEEFVYEARHGI